MAACQKKTGRPKRLSSNYSQDIRSVSEYVNKMCGCDTHGGRVFIVSDTRCIISDIPLWTDEMSQCIKGRFPSAEVSIFQCNQSLTGFNIVVVLHPPAYANLVSAMLFLLFFIVLCTFWLLCYRYCTISPLDEKQHLM